MTNPRRSFTLAQSKYLRFITFPHNLIAEPFTLENFQTLFSKTDALRWLFNSIYVVLIATLGGV